MKKNWFTVKKLFPNIWGIAEFEHSERVISYLFVGKKKALLFDTGMGFGNILDEIKKITKLPLIVINSHAHPDHVGGNYLFKNVWGVKEVFNLKKAKYGYTKEEIQAYYSAAQGVKPFKYSHFITSEQTVTIDPFKFLVMETPGHTPDSICLFEKTQKILLTGDTLYAGPIYLFLKESNIQKYTLSIKRLLKVKAKILLPGHNAFIMESQILKEVFRILNDFTGKEKFLKVDNETSLQFRI